MLLVLVKILIKLMNELCEQKIGLIKQIELELKFTTELTPLIKTCIGIEDNYFATGLIGTYSLFTLCE